MQKRQAAAEIFMQQNVLDEEDAVLTDDLSQVQSPEAAALAPVTPAPLASRARASGGRGLALQSGLKTSEELQLEKEPIHVRETGFGPWRRVIVPPNVYVVHTRMGHDKPVTLGLGCSFRYNPATDAYLVVPAAMQTIGVVANCISKEKQGINVLAYVQWQIADLSIAYRKLDFSDSRDPLGVVNAQLREQAEAAIKDKIATMSIAEVLTDKEPVIEELTSRLTSVSEGRGQGADAEGLGIKIVTVQIKEAFVSSQRLWENLQAPFRHEQDKMARISLLVTQDAVRQKELETRRTAEISEAETRVEIERITQSKQTEGLELRLTEEARRLTHEQESARQRIDLLEQTTRTQRESEQRLALQAAEAEQALLLAQLRRAQAEEIERARLDAESRTKQKTLQVDQALQELAEAVRLAERQLQVDLEGLERETRRKKETAVFEQLLQAQEAELERLRQAAVLFRRREETLAHIELAEAEQKLKVQSAEQEAQLARFEQETSNLVNDRALGSQLVASLPEVAAQLPEIHELKVWQTGQADGGLGALAQFLSQVAALAKEAGITLPGGKVEA